MQWQPSEGIDLEPNAQTAVTATAGNLAITAGPGAGKTELLAQRADFLLRTGSSRYPRRILAISFKVDAAANLRQRVRLRCPPEITARLDSFTFHAFALRLIHAFRPVLTGIDALDPDFTIDKNDRIRGRQITFDDMAPLATSIMRNSPIARTAVQQTYSHVFLDEFQDCTLNQYRLIQAAFAGQGTQLTAVGDTKQRIMGFAGALEGIFLRFAEDFEATPLNLYANHRSLPRLRRMQNAMVRVLEPQAALEDDDIPGQDGIIDILSYTTASAEARDLTDRIASWIRDEEVPAEQIAVLACKQINEYTEDLRSHLRRQGIPYRVETDLQDLATEPIAQIIIDFLTVITGSREPAAYSRLMDLTLDRLTGTAESESLYTRIRASIASATQTIHNRNFRDWESLTDDFLKLIGEAALVSLSPQYQQPRRLRELTEETYERLRTLLDSVGNLPAALREFRGTNAVRLLNIHKAKGMEFDRVIVPAIEQEMFWAKPDDERAVFFVAISRARHHLTLTSCLERPTPTNDPWRWAEARTEHAEFLGFARRYTSG
ncbi:ATP-dependent helicase [Kineosporia sp. NBRC 101731]|uniref:ATP-dependent helicase n=1 Tax=Kineosporia sp. NBRC 101731 TaxID=3032199 RepID=UPI002554A5CF|nr:ATP-dependent helicase [Kineosporia sp. NBRC 101731]